jgi:hypothetical protein
MTMKANVTLLVETKKNKTMHARMTIKKGDKRKKNR